MTPGTAGETFNRLTENLPYRRSQTGHEHEYQEVLCHGKIPNVDSAECSKSAKK